MLLGNARLGDRDVDVRIEAGRIVEIGPIGRGDIDLDGRWLLPGLWDEHVHFTQWALTANRLDLSGATSAREAAEIVRGAVGRDMLVGAGFRDGLWPDAPTAALLDAAAGPVPVVLVSADLHAVWLNSAALRQFGLADHATGLLREDAAFDVTRRIAEVDDATLDSWARAAAQGAAARGVVGIADLEMSWSRDTWERRIGAGHDTLRVQFAVYPQHLDRAIDEGLSTGLVLDELLTVGGCKVLTDGSLGTRTAYTYGAYPDGGTGMLTVEPSDLREIMSRAKGAGIDSWIHAIGDRANTVALDAFESTGASGRIEHAQLLRSVDVPRFAQLGVAASVQPEHAMDDRDLADTVWEGRTAGLYAFRSLLDSGARLRFGSDAPVAPLDPWLGISAAVTRTRWGREPWHPEQSVTPQEALDASTRTSVAVGEPADLVAVEADPFDAQGAHLVDMPVALTMLGGRITHDAL
ncbi:putative amidohydrolase YtcJ [Microbacteriaceae bacterium SG_E_30_P1]|uniref:Amidohydrolase YtcJ n=1 Tax=Antiquaquibacter oligotrophicus TaxID=2880260 RepID=A0ABT6KN37_9MICO|nr:amidohydrolase [Antiquaquibacter oligotrophicus]MDH6181264.1 putative amidohydrolase YtcJ [Antiquaquibacter oligotrophicus]UDF13041.1 amidohydrolase [Antiquaquibacter oligotrophicus]